MNNSELQWMKLSALPRTCPHLCFDCLNIYAAFHVRYCLLDYGLRYSTSKASFYSRYARRDHTYKWEIGIPWQTITIQRNLKGFWSLVKKLKLDIMAKFECNTKRWGVFKFFCRQVDTARHTTYFTSFAFSLMNLSFFIFMIHIKIIINKTDVYNIFYFREAPWVLGTRRGYAQWTFSFRMSSWLLCTLETGR